VLCYFGSLDEVFAAAHPRLVDGGLFLLSVETLAAAGDVQETGRRDWFLGRQGRYAHRVEYVEQAAGRAGFLIREAKRETLRRDMGTPVNGLVLALERLAA